MKMVTDYSTTVDNLKPKVTELERDLRTLTQDINQLKQQAEKQSKDAQNAVTNMKNTHQKAEDLNTQTLDLLTKIQDLLKQLSNSDWGGSSVPSEDAGKILKEAERLVKEMQNRNLAAQKDSADKELDEAKKLLDYIKNNCTKQFEKNQEAANRIKGLLKGYKDKLKDLEKALDKAKAKVQLANKQNTGNSQTLDDLLTRIKQLENEKKTVVNDMGMAKQQLKDAENLLNMLSDSKKEYEQLAAQLDGAKTDLMDRVNNISKAAALKGLVKKAEDHAAALNKLANELQDAIRNSSGRADVIGALSAIDAYKNITEAIKAAEEAAKKAKESSEKALNNIIEGDLPNRAKDLKDESNKLTKDAKNAAKDLKQLADDLKNQQQRLEDAAKKKAEMEKDLRDVNRDLKGIQRDDIAKIIDDAKIKAKAANDSASATMNKLKDINAEINAFDISGRPGQANIDGILKDVDMTVKNLSSSIPSLLDKISQVEKLSSELDPNNNISSNILRIKELIEQARDAANRITVPMKFTGTEHVELRMPRSLDDLRAYTALSLLLQRPEGRGDGRRRRRRQSNDKNLFVLYLGRKDASKDYLGMALRNNVLYFVYNLNGRVYEVKSLDITVSKSIPAYFDRVDVNRIYEDAEVNITKIFTSLKPDQPVQNRMHGDPIHNLLDLDPSEAVFYVGGYPDDFTPPDPLKYPRYQGCIELSMLNEKFISLYNFKALRPENVTLQTPCKRYMPSSIDCFEGSGYIKAEIDKVPKAPAFVQNIESQSMNAVLLYIGSQDSFCSVTVEKGYIVLRGRNGDQILPTTRSDTQQDVNGELRVILDTTLKKILVRKQQEIVSGPCILGQFSSYYIGGIPRELRERDNITVAPLKGCVSDVKAAYKTPNIIEKVGVTRGWPHYLLTVRKAEFGVTGSMESPPNDFSLDGDMTVSLGFKSTEKDGLLLQNKQAGRHIGLSMVNGYVILNYQNRVWSSKNQYQDGEWHYLTVHKQGATTEFWIDEKDNGKDVTDSPNLQFYSDKITLGAGSYTGCLSNVYLRRSEPLYRPEDLGKFSRSGDVQVDFCSSDRPPELLWAGQNNDFIGKEDTEELKRDSNCFLPTPFAHSFYLAGATSSLLYIVPSTVLTNRPYFSLDVRTKSAEGLLFYIPAEQEKYHLALYVSKGRIRFSVGRRREIFNREKYNDGKWHTVTVSLEKRRFRLVIDGLRAQDGVLNPGESSSIQLSSELYLGSPPSSVHRDLKWKLLPEHGVGGCVRNFKMNGSPMAAPAVNRGVGPCFEGQSESGAYFSGQRAYVIIDEAFVMSPRFELVLELRPSNETGLLLHVGDSKHHLTVFMRTGEVVAQVNNGGGEFRVSVHRNQSLCNGDHHRIAVIQHNNVVEMHVDTEGRYKIGPSSSSTTEAKFPVYIGGVPDHPWFSFLPLTEYYTGCLQNIIINGDPVVFEKLSSVFGAVNLRQCPTTLKAPQRNSRDQFVPLL